MAFHFLVALADAASETLKQWEAINSDEVVKSEAGTIWLVRTACKAILGCHNYNVQGLSQDTRCLWFFLLPHLKETDLTLCFITQLVSTISAHI